MIRLLVVCCFWFFVLCVSSAANQVMDLGQGLAYLRIRSIAESEVVLRKTVSGAGALVLDLRYATVNETAASTLESTLAGRPANALLFVLVSPATPDALAPVITASPALTLGAPGSIPAPKVVVQTAAVADRQAFDAFEAGTELSKLINGKIEKERFDEASLVQEFKQGGHPATTASTALPTPKVDPAPDVQTVPPSTGQPPGPVVPAPKEAAAPSTDRVLQRAIHLHRALLALRSR